MQQLVTKCNRCYNTMDTYDGAAVIVTERFLLSDKRRAFPQQSKGELDLCAKCYEPLAKVLREITAPLQTNGM